MVVKLGLLVVLLAIGGMNLVSRGRGPFGRRVGAELILAVCVFVATGFLTTLPPATDNLLSIEKNEAYQTGKAPIGRLPPGARFP